MEAIPTGIKKEKGEKWQSLFIGKKKRRKLE